MAGGAELWCGLFRRRARTSQNGAKDFPKEIKKALRAVNLDDSIVQEFGEAGQLEYLIRIRKTEVELSDAWAKGLNRP